MTILRIATGILFFIILITLTGCAKFPEGGVTQTDKRLIVTMRVRGQINTTSSTVPGFYNHYFVAIDVDNNPETGPIAAIYPPYGGTGWVTSEDAVESLGLTSFIQYDVENPQGYLYGVLEGSYFQNRTTPQPLINTEIIDGGSAIRFTIDFSQIATTDRDIPIAADDIEQLDINFITTNAMPINTNQYIEDRDTDGIGSSGNEYITINTTTDGIYSKDDIDAPNLTVTDPDLDIVSWQVEVQTVSSQ